MPFSHDFHSSGHSWTAGYECPTTFSTPGDWHTQEHRSMCMFQSLKKKKVDTCHKGKWKIQHQLKDHLGARDWQRHLPTRRKKNKQACSPCHSQSCPRWTGTRLQHLPCLSSLSIHPFPSCRPEEKILIFWLTSMPTKSGWCQVHPKLEPHTTSGANNSSGNTGSETYINKVMTLPRTRFSSTSYLYRTCCWSNIDCAANIKNVNFVKVWVTPQLNQPLS